MEMADAGVAAWRRKVDHALKLCCFDSELWFDPQFRSPPMRTREQEERRRGRRDSSSVRQCFDVDACGDEQSQCTYKLTMPMVTQSFETTAVAHWTSLDVLAARHLSRSTDPERLWASKKTPAPPPPFFSPDFFLAMENPLQFREPGAGWVNPSTRREDREEKARDSLVARASTVLPASSTGATEADNRLPGLLHQVYSL